IPGNLTYNDSLIVSGYDNINLTLLQDYSQFGAWFYWNQLAATLAVEDINNDPNILPDTKIQIKRFNNFAVGSNENGKFASGGQAIATAIEIIQNHTDVVAVFGDFLAKTTIYDNAVFSYNKIPFCGATQTSMNLLNRNNYPYYFQTMTFAGIGKSIALMLNAWNVKRMAVISTGSLNPPSAFCGTVLNSVRSRGIQVVASLGLTNAKQIDHISQTLTAADARYILVCGSPTDVGKIYFGMAATGSHVGPGYTWIAQNIPAVNPATAIKLYGPDYYKNARGIITAWNGNDPNAKMVQLQTQLVNKVDAIQAPFGFQFPSGDAIGNLNMAQSYDCVGMLATGINNLMLSRNTTSVSSDMKLAMNYTLFLNTGLNGLTGGPVILDELGEEAAGGQFAFVDGLTTDLNYVVFAFTDANSTKFTYSTTSGTMNDGTPLATAPVFFDGSSVPPADGPIYSSSMIAEGTSGRTLLLVLFSVGIILSFSFLIMIYYYRNHVAIIAGSIPFLTLMALGAVPSYASTFTYFDTPTTFKCYSRKWLQLLSFVIMCSCLILKNLRLAMIFSALAPLNPRTTSIYNWMWPIVFLVLIELVFLGMWTLYSRMTVATTVTGTQVNVVCVYGSNQGYKLGLGLWLYNILLLLGLYYATYRSQVVRSSHSEFPLLVIVSIGLFFGALLLVSTQTADDIVNNELQHF
ncbi:periplasmic binding protein-like I, partial [Chytriomyces sp. MP71]